MEERIRHIIQRWTTRYRPTWTLEDMEIKSIQDDVAIVELTLHISSTDIVLKDILTLKLSNL